VSQKIVGMLSSYQGLSDRIDWLWKQTPHPFGVWGNLQMLARAEKPDFLLLYQYDFNHFLSKKSPVTPWWKPWKKKKPTSPPDFAALMRGVPKERIVYLLREPPLEEIIGYNQVNYREAQKYCGYVSGPDRVAPNPDYMPAIWYVGNSFRELNEMAAPLKTRPCSWITSGINRTENHRQRLAFLKLICEDASDYDGINSASLRLDKTTVDIYGRGLPAWAKAYGSVENKWSAMAPYYYNLAIENYADNELYASEKLWDALLAWCLPIYYGGTAADKLLPPGSFLRLPSLDDRGLAYIKEVTSSLDAWHQAKNAIAEARQVILHKLNLLAWLSDRVNK
jgi:hypothetical protein